MNIQRFSTFSLLFLVGFFSLSANYLGRSRYLTPVRVCPYFGDLQPKQIPATSILHSSTSNKLLVFDRKGRPLEVEENLVRKARYIKTEQGVESFLTLYDSVCGGSPPYKHLMTYIQNTNLSSKEKRRQSQSDSKRFSALLNYSWKERLQKRREIATRVNQLKSELDALEGPRFQLIGKVLATQGRDLVIFGSSFPQGTRGLDSSGVVYNQMMILKGFLPNDIVSPPDFETKHVRAMDLEFVGVVRQDSVSATVFQHQTQSKQTSRIRKLRREIQSEMAVLGELF